MCAILDANVVGEVFGAKRPPAGQAFFKWINSGRGHLVIGGRLRQELDHSQDFKEWRVQAVLAGRITLLSDEAVDSKARQLKQENACRSDDEHVVAVAQLGGARLLYSNDRDLQADFLNKVLIDQPRGKVYSTQVHDDLRPGHKRLLANRNLCRKKPPLETRLSVVPVATP